MTYREEQLLLDLTTARCEARRRNGTVKTYAVQAPPSKLLYVAGVVALACAIAALL